MREAGLDAGGVEPLTHEGRALAFCVPRWSIGPCLDKLSARPVHSEPVIFCQEDTR